MTLQPGDWFMQVFADEDRDGEITTQRVTVVTYGPDRSGRECVWLTIGSDPRVRPYTRSLVQGLKCGDHSPTRKINAFGVQAWATP